MFNDNGLMHSTLLLRLHVRRQLVVGSILSRLSVDLLSIGSLCHPFHPIHTYQLECEEENTGRKLLIRWVLMYTGLCPLDILQCT